MVTNPDFIVLPCVAAPFPPVASTGRRGVSQVQQDQQRSIRPWGMESPAGPFLAQYTRRGGRVVMQSNGIMYEEKPCSTSE